MHKGGGFIGDIITEKQLCEWLSISPSTAWRWRKAGMPYMGKKKSIRYSKKEVEKWLKLQTKK
ncbi:MAG TPA: DNA-binding protein [Clostridiales bacterium]|nr:DNA-binding protein [Clostridiales bacterium]